MPKHKISPSTRFFSHKKCYEIFDVKIFADLVEKLKIFVQYFGPIRTALRNTIHDTLYISVGTFPNVRGLRRQLKGAVSLKKHENRFDVRKLVCLDRLSHFSWPG